MREEDAGGQERLPRRLPEHRAAASRPGAFPRGSGQEIRMMLRRPSVSSQTGKPGTKCRAREGLKTGRHS
jgi:hypothetical protein